MEIFPNPVQQILNIQLNTAKQEKYQLSILDMAGKEVMLVKYNLPMGKNLLLLPIDNLSSGTYLFVLQNAAGERETKKFVKN